MRAGYGVRFPPLFLPEPPKFRKSVKSLHFRVFYSPEQPLICPDERDTMRHSWMYIGLHPFRLHVVYCTAAVAIVPLYAAAAAASTSAAAVAAPITAIVDRHPAVT